MYVVKKNVRGKEKDSFILHRTEQSLHLMKYSGKGREKSFSICKSKEVKSILGEKHLKRLYLDKEKAKLERTIGPYLEKVRARILVYKRGGYQEEG